VRKLILLTVLAAVSGACSDPLAPSYTCKTQPRQYCAADLSQCWEEVDTYVSQTACPITPIR
jgi:hypothetical protein